MRVYLIRHGMTEANEKRLYCGFTDLPLSKYGREQLVTLKKTVIYPEAEMYVTSGLTRTSDTLHILYDREPDVIIKEFKEMNFGEFEMKSHDDLCEKPVYKKWIKADAGVACPCGESRDAFENRVMAGLEKLSGLNATSVVICHGGVIALIMRKLFSDQRNFYEWQPDFGRGYTIDIIGSSATLIAEL